MLKKIALGAALALGLTLTVNGAAAAAADENDIENYMYVFEDEGLLGDGLWGGQTEIKVRELRGRVFLIRPRASFVSELQKSVENL